MRMSRQHRPDRDVGSSVPFCRGSPMLSRPTAQRMSHRRHGSAMNVGRCLLALLLLVAGACDVDQGSEPQPEKRPAVEGRRTTDSGLPRSSANSEGEGHGLIGVDLWLCRGFETGWGSASGGYRYEGQMQIGNPNRTPFSFDSISIKYGAGDAMEHPRTLTGQMIVFGQEGQATYFEYDGKAPVIREQDKPTTVQLKGNGAIRFHFSAAAALVPTLCGRPPTTLSAVLLLGGKEVGQTYRAVLPPLMKLRDEHEAWQGGRFAEEKAYHLPMLPVSYLPAPSGALQEERIKGAFARAAAISEQAILAEVRPERMTLTYYTGGGVRLFPGGWSYEFWSPGRSFSVSCVDPAVSRPADVQSKPEHDMDVALLGSCRLDADAVGMVLESLGASLASGQHEYGLTAAIVAGVKRPLWILSYELGGKKVGVLADTGEVVTHHNGAWRIADSVIWNR